MLWADALVHWVHLLAAIVWVGGTLAVALIVHPVLRGKLADAQRAAVYAELGRRLSWAQWVTWSLLLASGLFKLRGILSVPALLHGPFGRVLAVKLALVAAMAVLSLLHARSWGPALTSPTLDPRARAALAAKAALWGKVNAALMVGIVLCGALLRFNPF